MARAGIDEHGEGREDRKQRHEVKHGALPEDPTDQTGEAADEDVAGAIAGGVAAQPLGQVGPPDKARVIAATVGANTAPRTAMTMSAASTTGTVGAQAIASALRRQGGDAGDEQAALEAGGVDERANRRVKRDTGQAAGGEHRADGRLVPVRLGQQEDLT